MRVIELLADMLDAQTACVLRQHAAEITEVRLRINRPVQLCLLSGKRISGERIDGEALKSILNRLMNNSMYACERELRQGYFTAEGGCRVGVCGRISADRASVDNLDSISSACIRIPRQIRGCAEALAQRVLGNPLKSMLILSPPGMGKTTMLRDLVRIISDTGRNVCIADERREIAACIDGAAQLDVGRCSDVMDGLSKALAVPMMIHACAPELVAVDELGSRADALAVLQAKACGVAVAATAHASTLQDALIRPCTAMLLQAKVFDCCVLLGPEPGRFEFLHESGNARFHHVQGGIADHHTSFLYGGRQGNFGAQEAPV